MKIYYLPLRRILCLLRHLRLFGRCRISAALMISRVFVDTVVLNLQWRRLLYSEQQVLNVSVRRIFLNRLCYLQFQQQMAWHCYPQSDISGKIRR